MNTQAVYLCVNAINAGQRDEYATRIDFTRNGLTLNDSLADSDLTYIFAPVHNIWYGGIIWKIYITIEDDMRTDSGLQICLFAMIARACHTGYVH